MTLEEQQQSCTIPLPAHPITHKSERIKMQEEGTGGL